MPNIQIGIFEYATTPPKPVELTGMEWAQDGSDWVARGKRGDFRLWKTGAWWHGRYCSYNNVKWFTLRPQRNLKELKSFCENNYYWER